MQRKQKLKYAIYIYIVLVAEIYLTIHLENVLFIFILYLKTDDIYYVQIISVNAINVQNIINYFYLNIQLK